MSALGSARSQVKRRGVPIRRLDLTYRDLDAHMRWQPVARRCSCRELGPRVSQLLDTRSMSCSRTSTNRTALWNGFLLFLSMASQLPGGVDQWFDDFVLQDTTRTEDSKPCLRRTVSYGMPAWKCTTERPMGGNGTNAPVPILPPPHWARHLVGLVNFEQGGNWKEWHCRVRSGSIDSQQLSVDSARTRCGSCWAAPEPESWM
ncbi:hypothetical protein IWX90DRAFT_64324 [Phyllosticta citrichinensis]|uniref:Uncharacterized protein n=1 Tax=Phyllosticta citrichinensis TaxID=1130410 RepID=A0ABR1XHI3_9PEZI